MNALQRIIKWTYSYEVRFGRRPKMVPISKPEMMEITSDYALCACDSEDSKDQLLGIDVETSPWAEMARQRILDIGVERLCMDQKIDERAFRINEHRDYYSSALIRTLTANILTDITHLDVSFDWDRFSWLKRRVKWIESRWPVKRKTVRIEGKVLYPYLKIQAPADTHRVRFLVQP